MNVPRQFGEDFAMVAAHYSCTPAEVDLMKAAARVDLEDAQRCFAELAREISAGKGGPLNQVKADGTGLDRRKVA